MICYFKGLFACATSRATINVPPDQCYERVLAQAFWVLHCLSQMSEYMSAIATLPLVTASLILGQEGLHALATLCLVEVAPQHAPSYHCIPTPRDALAQLLHRADITLPKAFALSATRVSTKKKLQSERRVQ